MDRSAGNTFLALFAICVAIQHAVVIAQTGATGLTGPTGATGMIGPTGLTGASGSSGLRGLTGGTGMRGNVGKDGTRGRTGARGSGGNNGNTGSTGAAGASGRDGHSGASGPKGVHGDTGSTGRVGPLGLTGATGMVGLNGDMGEHGRTGATGMTGTRGQTGAQGRDGVPGAIVRVENECLANTSLCEQHCIDTYESYFCRCSNGFEIVNSDFACPGVSSRERRSVVDHILNNPRLKRSATIQGTFYCHYYSDIGPICFCKMVDKMISVNGTSCQDVDECLTRNGGCSDRCINTEGSYKCACGVESVLGPDGRICKESAASLTAPIQVLLVSLLVLTGQLTSYNRSY